MQEHEVVMESTPAEGTLQGLRDEDLVAFVKAYPGLDSTSIPKSVWDSVRSGSTLMEAYGSHERAQLREDNRRLKEEMDRMTCAGAIALHHGIMMKVIPSNVINLKITYKNDMDVFRYLVHPYFPDLS